MTVHQAWREGLDPRVSDKRSPEAGETEWDGQGNRALGRSGPPVASFELAGVDEDLPFGLERAIEAADQGTRSRAPGLGSNPEVLV